MMRGGAAAGSRRETKEAMVNSSRTTQKALSVAQFTVAPAANNPTLMPLALHEVQARAD